MNCPVSLLLRFFAGSDIDGQDRSAEESALAGATDLESANRYLAEVYMPACNAESTRRRRQKARSCAKMRMFRFPMFVMIHGLPEHTPREIGAYPPKVRKVVIPYTG